MIEIQKSPTADTRTCDYENVTRETLLASSIQHIRDVYLGLLFFRRKLEEASRMHDWTKIEGLDQFHADFLTGFDQHDWWDTHREAERHHINMPDGVREDVDLVDVLEHIVDCVMAGMARSGSVYELELPNELLQNAVRNTVNKLKAEVEVTDA